MAINKASSLKQLSRDELEQLLENSNLTLGLLKQSLANERDKTNQLLTEREQLRKKFLVRLFGWLDE